MDISKRRLTLVWLLFCAILLMLEQNMVLAKHSKHVHINVWRGTSKGHKKHKFAPWGLHAKLPADQDKHHA